MYGTSFSVSAPVTINSAGAWVGGTLTINTLDGDNRILATATVTLDNTLAAFVLGDGTSFEKEDWASDRLAP